MFCQGCGRPQASDHRFCPACGRALTPRDQGLGPKVTQLFLGVPAHPDDAAEPVLRVSWYLEDHVFSAAEGDVSVPGHHVRFSIWPVDHPVCAMSLPEDEAARLARFLSDTADASSMGSER